ncbi:ferritin family protein [Clostridium massiliamazoniense]|uniref:ferritin family protein n=1 Tax=Clostridium massiliamazoniense TaxID=1347366 RepID=UPI0006D7F8E3|nr:ferritin-like domain-containing protein [Clostridium massiliamazoniense]
MSYTTNRQPQGTAFSVGNFLRETMIGELVAINDYSEHIHLCNLDEVNKILHHILEEEKKHYGMLLNALRKVDKAQAEKAEEVNEQPSIKSKPLKYTTEKGKNCSTLLNAIRFDIKGELEAIISYEDVFQKLTDPVLKAMLREIINDEIEHVEELTRILLFLDKDCYGPLNTN